MRPLLALLEVVLDAGPGAADALDAEVAVDIALVAARRRATPSGCAGCGGHCGGSSWTNGGGRTSDELLAEALARARCGLIELGPRGAPRAPRAARPSPPGSRPRRAPWTPGPRSGVALGAGCQRGVGALGDVGATGLGAEWQATALRVGAGAARADRDLDAVVGLFDAAASSSTGCRSAGPEEFLDHIRGQDIPGDTLVARSPVGRVGHGARRRRRPRVASGTSSSSPACRRGSGPTCGCAARCSGSEDLVDVVTGRATDVPGGPGRGALRRDAARSSSP